MRTLADSVVRIRRAMVVWLELEVVLQPFDPGILVRRLGQLGLGWLCWPWVYSWVPIFCSGGSRTWLKAHSSYGLKRAKEGWGDNSLALFLAAFIS